MFEISTRRLNAIFGQRLRNVKFCIVKNRRRYFVSKSTITGRGNTFRHGSVRESNKLIAHRETEEEGGGRRNRLQIRGKSPGHEKIVESNIRRAFTVRFPNLYCVWQRCRDIRGSYRNVLLLIVPPPWRWCTIYDGKGEGGVCTRGERETG